MTQDHSNNCSTICPICKEQASGGGALYYWNEEGKPIMRCCRDCYKKPSEEEYEESQEYLDKFMLEVRRSAK